MTPIEKKVEDAKENVKQANQDLKDAQLMRRMAVIQERRRIQNYHNEKAVDEFKAEIKTAGKNSKLI